MKYIVSEWAPDGQWHQWTTEVIYEADRVPQKTGLLDQFGRPLYRVPEAREIGFTVRSARS